MRVLIKIELISDKSRKKLEKKKMEKNNLSLEDMVEIILKIEKKNGDVKNVKLIKKYKKCCDQEIFIQAKL